MRFSILTLLGIVAFAAVGCAALLNANQLWAEATYSIAFVTLLIALVAALMLRGGTRAFCIGFAVFGIAYFSDLFSDQSQMITYSISENLHDWTEAAPRDGSAFVETPSGLVRPLVLNPFLVLVFHSLFSIVFAYAGGLIGCCFYSLRQKQNAQAAEHA